ncbi:MAG: FAD:protein FMN transferase [Clostridia bacterium]|nr:FAD:protein FMN transferase [Clostridia bacterium]
MRKLIRCLALLLPALLLLSCVPANNPEEIREQKQKVYYQYFDTFISVTAASMTETEFEELLNVFEGEIDEWHRMSDAFYRYEGTVSVREVNERAAEEAVAVSQKMIDLLLWARTMGIRTGGKMNPVLGSVTALWHEARETALSSPDRAYVPDGNDIAEALKHTDMSSLVIDPENRTVSFLDPEMKIDLGACAKGYAEQRIADLLRERGYDGVMLNFGGNVCLIGSKNEKSWVVGIQSPSGEEGQISTKLYLRDLSVSTSGSYFRYYDFEGVRYHHLLDVETGYPARGFLSVSVVCPDAGEADALSTALFAMSLSEGQSLVSSLEGTEAFWILENGETARSEGFADYEVKS